MTDEIPHATGDSGPGLAAVVLGGTIDVSDFPKPGIVFKDLMPFFADGRAFRTAVDGIVAHHGPGSFDVVAGVEARGFVVAAAIAYAAGVGVVPVRKAGKLPRQALSASYELEYGEATLEVHEDAFIAGQRVLVVDDVLATGGTAAAALELVERAGGTVAGFTVLMELAFLKGRERLSPRTVHALLTV
ncbi:adenine phosphoribosyltransferase [Actinoplanes brasiliensis]|uniref:Adenine phosphoribosyltransferase n=1 Tax=Paractinoplanes brasiliensis TaxID=52695 RepID=A0A4R6JXW5_9ACTN|nr:adenine phosphoribosyltransferase [Actinoplanes brasiliensis]GID27153.1 adenine phosphoribosyltransferase [Actinoplanes brasiliensis]